MNHSMDSAIIKNIESPISKIASQLLNITDEIPIQPCANFLTSFRQNFIPGTASALLSITSLTNSHSSLTGPSKHLSDNLLSPHESDESMRSLMLSM